MERDSGIGRARILAFDWDRSGRDDMRNLS